MVKRLYVEKKKGFDTSALNLKRELRERLGASGLKRVRVINRYDIENISDEVYKKAKGTVFSVPGVDDVYDERIDIPEDAFAFGMAYLPGQFDQRADTAETGIRLIDPDAKPIVKCAKIIVIESPLAADVQEKILRYYINPVDSERVSFEKPETLEAKTPETSAIAICEGFRQMDDAALHALEDSMGFAMSHEDLRFVQSYFAEEEFRDPTVTELRAIDTYWSDHCRHTTFLTHLTGVSFEEGGLPDIVKETYEEYLQLRRDVYGDEAAEKRPVTLMDMATIGAKYLKRQGKLEDLDESEEVNACSVRIKAEMIREPGAAPVLEDWLFMFKNETHNHPTEIEPLGGASTCLGGGIRDPLSGRAYVHQAMRITGCGDPHTPLKDTLPGKLTQYQITRTAAKGYSSYGNQIGASSGLIQEIYDDSYVAKRMELGALVAAAPAENVVRQTPAPGDLILLVGGRTGRDGIGAATGSSKEQSEESIRTAGAEVQKGNPSLEKGIVRLFRRPEVSKLIKRCNDFGAGGVSVAIGELAPSLDVDLDRVRAKYDGMDGTELALSESQERMAVVIAKENAEAFYAYAAEENTEAYEVAKVTDTGRFRMYWRGDLILDLSRKFIDTNGVPQKRSAAVRAQDIALWGGDTPEAGLPGRKELLGMITDLNCASQRGLIEQFDSTAGAGTLLMPLGGRTQRTPAAGMAAKLPAFSGDTNTATLMAYGFDPKIAKNSAFHSAMYAVLDSCAKICAMGGDAESVRLSFQEFFPRLGNVPARWASPVMALLGSIKAQISIGVPSIGGKDSMSGSFRHIDVVPTLVSFAVQTADARHLLSPEFKQVGSGLILLACPRDKNFMPNFEVFKDNARRVHQLAGEGKILAASTIPYGGLFTAVSKMAIGNEIGAVIYASDSAELLNENYGSLLLEIDGAYDPEDLFAGLSYRVIGETADSGSMEIRRGGGASGGQDEAIVISLSEIAERMDAPLAAIFPIQPDPAFDMDTALASADYNNPNGENGARRAKSAKIGIAKPRVFIPVLPGTNCEFESKRAFERAGADVCLVNLLSMKDGDIGDSVGRMAEEIRKSQIVMLPGGYSGGDEPEGSAKFMEILFRNPCMAEAVTDLLENRDGLILGICTGFQALVKLGLLPYGKITDRSAGAPALAIIGNTMDRYVSRLVRVRVSSTLSPWLSHTKVGDVHTVPVAHGEGRFVCDGETLTGLAQSGRIATQYADLTGAPTYDIRYNPNGSILAVEGLTSPDGRVFGRMGHSERNAPGLYINVPGDYDSHIFTSGVGYFK